MVDLAVMGIAGSQCHIGFHLYKQPLSQVLAYGLLLTRTYCPMWPLGLCGSFSPPNIFRES